MIYAHTGQTLPLSEVHDWARDNVWLVLGELWFFFFAGTLCRLLDNDTVSICIDCKNDLCDLYCFFFFWFYRSLTFSLILIKRMCWLAVEWNISSFGPCVGMHSILRKVIIKKQCQNHKLVSRSVWNMNQTEYSWLACLSVFRSVRFYSSVLQYCIKCILYNSASISLLQLDISGW